MDAINSHQRLLIALLVAALVHVLVLSLWDWQQPVSDFVETLKIDLISIGKEPVRQRADEPALDLMPESASQARPVLEPRIEPPERRIESARISGVRLLDEAISRIRQSAREKVEEPAKIRSFSVSDLPGKGLGGWNPFSQVSWLTRMTRKPEVIHRQNRLGYHVIKTVDQFGNVFCVEQRGWKGDGNPALWYIVPNC